jgi:PAS domain S-box-containing protein
MTDARVEFGWSDAQADCRRLFEENSHPMWVVARIGLLEVNRAAVLHYGYSREEFLAMTVGDLEATEGSEEKVAERHGVQRHRRQNGSFIEVEITSFAITFGGRPALLTSILDVTSRWRAEAEKRSLDLMLETAAHVSYAGGTIRALLNDALAALEAERRRIACELQAETAQSLASLLVGLLTVEESQDLGQAKGAASTVRGLVAAALDGVDCLTRGLGPSAARFPPARR